MKKVWIQKWEESEAGWGSRPDGFTMHVERSDIEKFLVAMRAREKADHKAQGKPPGYVPPEYSRPCGTPYEVEVPDEVFDAVKAGEHGIWAPSGLDDPPGAKDGWISKEHQTDDKAKLAAMHLEWLPRLQAAMRKKFSPRA